MHVVYFTKVTRTENWKTAGDVLSFLHGCIVISSWIDVTFNNACLYKDQIWPLKNALILVVNCHKSSIISQYNTKMARL